MKGEETEFLKELGFFFTHLENLQHFENVGNFGSDAQDSDETFGQTYEVFKTS
jgi:hypothetical protein